MSTIEEQKEVFNDNPQLPPNTDISVFHANLITQYKITDHTIPLTPTNRLENLRNRIPNPDVSKTSNPVIPSVPDNIPEAQPVSNNLFLQSVGDTPISNIPSIDSLQPLDSEFRLQPPLNQFLEQQTPISSEFPPLENTFPYSQEPLQDFFSEEKATQDILPVKQQESLNTKPSLSTFPFKDYFGFSSEVEELKPPTYNPFEQLPEVGLQRTVGSLGSIEPMHYNQPVDSANFTSGIYKPEIPLFPGDEGQVFDFPGVPSANQSENNIVDFERAKPEVTTIQGFMSPDFGNSSENRYDNLQLQPEDQGTEIKGNNETQSDTSLIINDRQTKLPPKPNQMVVVGPGSQYDQVRDEFDTVLPVLPLQEIAKNAIVEFKRDKNLVKFQKVLDEVRGG